MSTIFSDLFIIIINKSLNLHKKKVKPTLDLYLLYRFINIYFAFSSLSGILISFSSFLPSINLMIESTEALPILSGC